MNSESTENETAPALDEAINLAIAQRDFEVVSRLIKARALLAVAEQSE